MEEDFVASCLRDVSYHRIRTPMEGDKIIKGDSVLKVGILYKDRVSYSVRFKPDSEPVPMVSSYEEWDRLAPLTIEKGGVFIPVGECDER